MASQGSLHLPVAYCVPYGEKGLRGDVTFGAYVYELTLFNPDGFTLTPGSARAYVAPAAREHGRPSVAAPFVVGTDGVPRLPRITGDPPSKVKGPHQGKPGMDRVEFARQLTGQQQGLNHLTVADFLANCHAAFSFYEGSG